MRFAFVLQNLQDDVNRLQQRVKELESNNNSLSSLLLQRLQRNSQNTNAFHANSANQCGQALACLQSSLYNKLDIFTKVIPLYVNQGFYIEFFNHIRTY